MNSEHQTTERKPTAGGLAGLARAMTHCVRWTTALWEGASRVVRWGVRRPAVMALSTRGSGFFAHLRRHLPSRAALRRGTSRFLRVAGVGVVAGAAVLAAGKGLVMRIPAEAIGVRAAR